MNTMLTNLSSTSKLAFAKYASKTLFLLSVTFVSVLSPFLTCAPEIPSELKK
ncbi:hypothetical protein D3C73_812380 [compost metagenome]